MSFGQEQLNAGIDALAAIDANFARALGNAGYPPPRIHHIGDQPVQRRPRRIEHAADVGHVFPLRAHVHHPLAPDRPERRTRIRIGGIRGASLLR